MVSTTDTISQEQIIQLIQTLLESKEKNELPDELETAVNVILDAQKKFIDKIECQLHTGFQASAKDTVQSIIEICPEFLSSERDINGEGSETLLVNTIFSNLKNAALYIPMFALAGYCQDDDKRGGLLAETLTDYGVNGNVFQILSRPCVYKDRWIHNGPMEDTVGTFRALSATVPPLFTKEDIKKYKLLHYVASDGRDIKLAEYFISLNPSELYSRPDCDSPLCYTIYDDCVKDIGMFKLLLVRGIQHANQGHCKIGGLFEKEDGKSVFEYAIDHFGEDEVWKCIQSSLTMYSDTLPILHSAIQNAPREQLGNFFMKFPDSLYVRNEFDQLPIHVALESGLGWSLELLACVNTNKEALKEVDPVSKLTLFALAAVSRPDKNSDLTVLYYVLRSHPEQLWMQHIT